VPEVARTVIEHLRSGVPSPEVADALSAGREGLLDGLEADMSRLALGGGGPRLEVLTANYGDGKSHLLNALWLRARHQGWLVSMVTVSRETPLDQPERIYRKVAARTFAPGVRRPGLGPLFDRLAERPETTQRVLRDVERSMHPKVALALAARLEGRGDPTTVDEDLHGYRHSVADVRRAYQERTGLRPPKVEPYRAGEHGFDYFRMVDAIVRGLEIPGWLVLFDEVEMIAGLGRAARARSYALVDRFASRDLVPSTFSVWMVSSNFRPRVMDDLRDPDVLPGWLAARGQEALARQIVRPLESLVAARALPPLSDEDVRAIFDTIIDLHARALAWRPPLDGADLLARIRVQLPERDVKVRQLVRAAVQYLDLTRQHGVEPRLRLRAVVEGVWPVGEEPSPDVPVVREWPED